MLRIITRQRGSTYQLELHGSIAGDEIALLESHWRDLVRSAPGAKISIGLSNVVFINRDGEELLRLMAQSGVKLDGAGCMNRYVIEKITGGV